MIALPLPLLTFMLACTAAALIARQDLGVARSRMLFIGFFACIALGSLLVGVRFGYGVRDVAAVQRSVPFLAGPLVYLGFAVLTVPPSAARRMQLLHLGIAATFVLAGLVGPGPLPGTDVLIAGSSLVYGVLILRLWRAGPNGLERARLEAAEPLARWLLPAAAFLFLSLLGDGAIAVAFALGHGAQAVGLISFGAVLMSAGLAVVIGKMASRAPRIDRPRPEAPAREPVLVAADALLVGEKLFLDTGLSVERLARRLHVPARTLSAAVNAETGMNVSQFVNGYRLRHAAALLRETSDSVTGIAERSGFLSRSNFYRAFGEAYGETPAEFRARNRSPDPA